MTYRLVADPSALAHLSRQIESEARIAIDCEAAGFHRYSDRLCLVQLSTPAQTFLLDPLQVDLSGVLKPVLEDPGTEVVMHGADYDLRLLHRDLGIRVRGLFDTQVAASLLGASSIGLAALLEEQLGVTLSKEHQRSDWAQRPLPESLLSYAADDTRHLMALAEKLADELREKGRKGWAEEEFRALEEVRWTGEDVDPVTRIKGARDLTRRQVASLRAALRWRDGIARERDRAPFRVVGDAVLLAVVLERPDNPEKLASMKGMSPRLARAHGAGLMAELARVDALREEDLDPLPRWNRNGFGRPTPEEEAKADDLRNLRSALAHELELERGVVLSNGQISAIVRAGPQTMEELRALPGIRGWQMELLGTEILRILA